MFMTNGTPSIHTTEGKLNELRRRMAEAQAPVGQDSIDKVHEAGRNAARTHYGSHGRGVFRRD